MTRAAAAPAVAAAALLLHLALLAPFVQARRLLEPAPFAYGDYSIHLVDGLQVREFLRHRGAFWGWSPWFFAGYPAGVFDAPSNRATGLVLWLAGGAAPAVAFKLYVASVLAAIPLVLAAAAGRHGRDLAAGALGLVLAVAWFHQDRVAFTFCRYGMFHFLLACALAVLAVVEHARLLERPGRAATARSALLLAAALFAHPAAPVLLVLPLAWVHASHRRDRRATRLGLAALAAAALVSLPWAAALARNAPWVGPDSGFWSTGAVTLAGDLWLRADLVVRNLLLAVAAAGAWLGGRRQLPLAAASALCLVIRHAGSSIPVIDRLEPARFTLPAAMFALPVAVEGVRRLAARPRAALAAAGAALLLAAVPIALDPDFEPVPHFLLWSMPLDERPEAAALAAALERHTDRSARIAVEQDWAGSRLHGFIASYLRLHVDREQLNGPHPFVKVRANALRFFDGSLAGRRLGDWPPGELHAFLDRYNVGWIVARLPATIAAAGARPDLHREAEGPGFALYRTRITPSFVVAGSARVRASLDRIEVEDAPAGGVVLKYHYHPALVAEPTLPVSKEPVPGDPDGFIRVDNGPHRAFRLVVR